ncbi:helix-turn-helix transcriptional regulator [Parasedimentitalea marina]|uniref:Helix-turn-helix transcriptional regulator n=1 Tax=Parasedimentitalea marina TaxID=2483033 RepID=A0A3T0N791_9RHOB|nr:LuxR C-terminal-related transcriptional regulator [Parasedimentitalea marina]AZV79822.1 helix-turn-helix transcriptional regulator [Parasedimentitalea marina]
MRKSTLFWLWLLLVVQALCATFFVFDAMSDWLGSPAALSPRHYHLFELLLSLALLGGLFATGLQIRALSQRQHQMRRQLDVASGAFAELIDQQFTNWQLSSAERDVALLAIKGLPVAEIAALRQTKKGTVKAQCAAVYRKAGVTGRLQLLSYFIEELLADPLLPHHSPPAGP